VTRRFYWELVRARALDPTVEPARLLADVRLAPVWSRLRALGGAHPLRLACLVELDDDSGRHAADLARAAGALLPFGIALDLWPQLPDDGARFLNTSTAAIFQARLLPLLDALVRDPAGRTVGVALDVEPAESLLQGAWKVRRAGHGWGERAGAVVDVVRGLGRAVLDARQGRRDLVELARDLEARDLNVHVAVMPPLVTGAVGQAARSWLLGCPIVDDDGAPLFRTQAAMCYGPLLRTAPGAWPRERQRKTLALWAARHRQDFDAVVAGLLSTGLLGDEPVIESLDELQEDLASLRALEFMDVALYSLEGLLWGRDGTWPEDMLPTRAGWEDWAASFLQ
jgi:hypothetical protein